MTTKPKTLFRELVHTVESINGTEIPQDRKEVLAPLIDLVQQKVNAGKEAKLNFICTHNSRRSQFAQVWATVAAHYHGVQASCYSGGVEVTAFNERAMETLSDSGFKITGEGTANPRYFLSYSDDAPPIVAFSKLFDDPGNPEIEFGAIMTCSHADENCPFIPGAEERIPVRYEDPKKYDGTPKEKEKYRETSLQIASEMFFLFSQIKSPRTNGTEETQLP